MNGPPRNNNANSVKPAKEVFQWAYYGPYTVFLSYLKNNYRVTIFSQEMHPGGAKLGNFPMKVCKFMVKIFI